MPEFKLDEERVAALCDQIMTLIRDHLAEGEKDRTKVYEALNALAVAAGTIIGGTMDPVAMDFFTTALFKQMQQAAIDQAESIQEN